MINYQNPSVKLIAYTNPELGYLIWLQSKSTVVKELDDKSIQIGSSHMTHTEYFDKVMNMNMQYNNLPYFVFEIDGSILFRDLLYNINKTNQWATSLRLVHSTFKELDIANYAVSSEYKDSKSWEAAFYEYFESLKSESRVDKNRVSMPYSIQSKYWIGMNYKTLVNLLSALKNEMPFFYEVYGKLMQDAYDELVGEDQRIEKYYTNSYDTAITQCLDYEDDFKESVAKVGHYYLVNIDMGLILYSQFIRQADTQVSGLWHMLVHSNPDEFKNKVFTGNTIIPTTYIAHESKVRKTLKNRSCWFSQSDSSDDDPRYWSKFLKLFTENLSVEEFKKLLPCKFADNRLIACQYHEDVKFRDEGLQKGYIPCAILNNNIEYAKKRLEETDNSLNRMYVKVMKSLDKYGYQYLYQIEAFTSLLRIHTNKMLEDNESAMIFTILNNMDVEWNKNGKKCISVLYNTERYKKYALGEDCTCMAKGLAMQEILELLKSKGHDSMIISFGGDIVGYHTPRIPVRIEDTNFYIDMSGTYSVFTSGNTEKRGNHIVGGNRGITVLASRYESLSEIDLPIVDASATKFHAGEMDMTEEIPFNSVIFSITEDGKISNPTYCASPFFNPTQVAIRDRMVSKFTNPFRPDLTESSKDYDENHNNDAVVAVVDDNINGITNTQFLVFPNNTNDLGTLFEVGTAIAIQKVIIRYQEDFDKYYISLPSYDLNPPEDVPTIFDCSNKRAAISIGTASCFMSPKNIFYELKGSPDNIMLSVYYNHVEKVNGKYELIKRDENDRDQ